MKPAHLIARRSLTRDERKKQVLYVFDMSRRSGKMDGMTAQKIATEIGMLSDDLVRALCKELVADGQLNTTRRVHRKLKNGQVIEKDIYWRVHDEEIDEESENMRQKSMF